VITFFELNRDLIYFAYGLVFFVLGLAIALQTRKYSRLDLARSLTWLAAFGFAHGFNEWGDLFIPIQAAYLSPVAIEWLHRLHLLVLACSFAFLFEFGVTLLKPLGRLRWLHGLSGLLLVAWTLITFLALPAIYADAETWHHIGDALARYLIGFTGGMLSAFALRWHTMQRIAPLNVPHIVRTLRFAGIMLALYAVFGGLITPPIPFFPGNLLNSPNFQAFLGVPPPVFRSIIGFGLALAIIRALEVFDVETERMIEAMEQKQILDAERNRIARELHDGAIQKVYTAGLLVESASKLAAQDDGVMNGRLEKAQTVLNDAIGDLRRNLGELSSSPGKEPLEDALRRLAGDPRFRSLVDITLQIDLPPGESLSPVRTDHVIAVVNEALSNVVRHSRARRVHITARLLADRLVVEIADDGVGVGANPQAGYGLRNMRDRARLLGGEAGVSSEPGKGTRVVLNVPWRDER